MYSIAIISDMHDWHSNEIKFYLEKFGCKVAKVSFEEIVLSLKKKRVSISGKNSLKKIDGVWVRFIKAGTLEEITSKLTILHLLEESNIYIHNSASTIEKTVDKVRTTGILEINGFNSPETSVWFSKNKNIPKLKKKQKFLVKPIFGSQGKGIILIKNIYDLLKFKPLGNVFYVQNFIGSDKQKIFSDLRILVSNHKVLSSMERYSKNFITNVHQGANFKKKLIDSEIIKTSEKISKIFGLGYGGIDIKIANKKLYVLEINSVPSWKAIQKIEKKNISQLLVRDFLKKIKKNDIN